MRLKQILLVSFVAFAQLGTSLAVEPDKPSRKRRILVTNDNGIDDPKVVALAREFAKTTETWLVAPNRDQSGTGARLTLTKTGKLVAESRQMGDEIKAFAVEGTPGDCVILALTALMDSPPDLIVSGINGGPNLGSDWLYSGTVGAARVAAFGGIPAIAVSGLDDDSPSAVASAVRWVVKLSSCTPVTALRPGEYLTVSIPRINPNQIRGIRIVDRAKGLPVPELARANESTWKLVGLTRPENQSPEGSDRQAYEQGYIAVVPMTIHEVDSGRLRSLRQESSTSIPMWKVIETSDK